MPADLRQQSGQQTLVETHEKTGINVKGVGIFLLILFAGMLITHAVLWWMLKAMQEAPDETVVAPRSVPTEGQPAYPRLQVAPARDLEQYRAAEEQILNSYGWVDRTSGVVRIPIRRAMELLVQRSASMTNGALDSGRSPLDLQRERAASPQP